MTKFFLVKVELPDWADNPAQLETVRDEIEQFSGASAALHMRATHVTSKCEIVDPPMPEAQSLRWMGPKV